MAITPQERELVTIGIAVASGCKACLWQNKAGARELHASDKDIDDAISTAIRIREAATNSVENFVSSGFAETVKPEPHLRRHDNQRIEVLVSVGAAFAVNCVANLKDQIENAKAIGISEGDLHAVVSLSAFMKAMAASHVERLMDADEIQYDSVTLAEYGTPFGPQRCAWAELCKSDTAMETDW